MVTFWPPAGLTVYSFGSCDDDDGEPGHSQVRHDPVQSSLVQSALSSSRCAEAPGEPRQLRLDAQIEVAQVDSFNLPRCAGLRIPLDLGRPRRRVGENRRVRRAIVAVWVRIAGGCAPAGAGRSCRDLAPPARPRSADLHPALSHRPAVGVPGTMRVPAAPRRRPTRETRRDVLGAQRDDSHGVPLVGRALGQCIGVPEHRVGEHPLASCRPIVYNWCTSSNWPGSHVRFTGERSLGSVGWCEHLTEPASTTGVPVNALLGRGCRVCSASRVDDPIKESACGNCQRQIRPPSIVFRRGVDADRLPGTAVTATGVVDPVGTAAPREVIPVAVRTRGSRAGRRDRGCRCGCAVDSSFRRPGIAGCAVS